MIELTQLGGVETYDDQNKFLVNVCHRHMRQLSYLGVEKILHLLGAINNLSMGEGVDVCVTEHTLIINSRERHQTPMQGIVLDMCHRLFAPSAFYQIERPTRAKAWWEVRRFVPTLWEAIPHEVEDEKITFEHESSTIRADFVLDMQD